MSKCVFSDSENPIELVKSCLHTFSEINSEIYEKKEPIFDLSDCKWIFPCTAILLSNKITELQNKGLHVKIIPPRDKNAKAYFGTIGFPEGRVIMAKTYSPIHHFTKKSEEEVAKILKKIESEFPLESIVPIKYILSELGGNNIEEHSQYTLATIMAQYYAKKCFIDIGIFDNGITIPGKFEKSKISFDNEDGKAIFMALGGISTKAIEGGRGFGLSTSQKLVLNGLKGEFYLFSRKGMVVIDHETLEHKIYKYQNETLPGTLIYIRFKTPPKKIQMEKYYG